MTTDWDHSYTHDFSEEWEEEPLIEHRRADVCPLCHLKPCIGWCYNARHETTAQEGSITTENVREERGRRDLE
jgi:hypothetical protein